jgi:acyl CoA:acetate/3-ketoacid CoA transferase beta subunit
MSGGGAPSAAELRAVFLAHDLRDGEVGCCGVGAAIPFAAMRLAQETHAPNLTIALEGQLNPRPRGAVRTPTDPRIHTDSEAVGDLADLLVASERGLDFWFMSAVQTDRHGNLGHFGVGRRADGGFDFRAPGVGNVSLAATCGRWYNVPDSHAPRGFVERVDFVSAIGNGPRRKALRARNPNAGEGCRFVVTPLAVLDFDAAGSMRPRHLMPGVTAADLVAATGFELAPPAAQPSAMPAPSAAELEILRRVVDPDGALRQ